LSGQSICHKAEGLRFEALLTVNLNLETLATSGAKESKQNFVY